MLTKERRKVAGSTVKLQWTSMILTQDVPRTDTIFHAEDSQLLWQSTLRLQSTFDMVTKSRVYPDGLAGKPGTFGSIEVSGEPLRVRCSGSHLVLSCLELHLGYKQHANVSKAHATALPGQRSMGQDARIRFFQAHCGMLFHGQQRALARIRAE